MGHRSLIAFQRNDGNFDIHYSHWGSTDLRLEQKITKNQPLGGDSSAPPFIGELLGMIDDQTDENVDVGGELTKPQTPTEVEHEPEVVNVPKDDLGEVVDDYGPGIEAFYVVTREFEVTGFWNYNVRFGETDFGTILFQPSWYNGEPNSLSWDRGSLSGTKKLLNKQINDGLITVEEAYDMFLQHVFDHFKRSMDKRVLPYSTAIPSSYYHDEIVAFLKVTGTSSIPPGQTMRDDGYLDNSVPTGFKDYQPWELPEDFPNPEEFVDNPEKLNPHQFDERGNFIPGSSNRGSSGEQLTQATLGDV